MVRNSSVFFSGGVINIFNECVAVYKLRLSYVDSSEEIICNTLVRVQHTYSSH